MLWFGPANEEANMPQILIVTDSGRSAGEVVYRERVLAPELGSRHFSAQLIERIGWALGDATTLEHRAEKMATRPRRRVAA
jgi:hypothetical protein